MNKKKKKSSTQKLQNKPSQRIEKRFTAVATSFSGPLPPPNILEGYEKIIPGAADRIITMAEKQSNHRQSLENIIIRSNTRNESIGMWLAFILTIGLMCFGFYL